MESREIRLKTKFSREFLTEMIGLHQPYIASMKTEFRQKAIRTQKPVAGSLKFSYAVLMPSLPETVSILRNICDISVTGDLHQDQTFTPSQQVRRERGKGERGRGESGRGEGEDRGEGCNRK